MAKIISLVSRKGGAGKSTTAQAMAAGFTAKGYRVLSVDLDGQGSLTHIMNAKDDGVSIVDVLTGKATITDAVQHTGAGDIIAAKASLDKVNITGDGAEFMLKELLEPVKGAYDLILIDTAAVVDIMTVNALTASAGVIIPAQADALNLKALSNTYVFIKQMRNKINAALKIYGVLLTRFNSRSKTAAQIAETFGQAAEFMQTRLFSTRIRESAAVGRSQGYKTDLLTYRPRSNAAKDYEALINELEEILKLEAD